MTRLHAALVALACLAPGAALADMSCAEFNGMDKDSQMQIVGSMADSFSQSIFSTLDANRNFGGYGWRDSMAAMPTAMAISRPSTP